MISLAKKEKLNVTVFDEKTLKQKKFGAILAVAAGSQSKPRLLMLELRHKKTKDTIVLVGKGITFDSGGINLKPSASLADMKSDMSGAAAVAATLITLAKLKPSCNVIGIIPVVENMPSGNASRPGDIIKSYDGKTVEIGNTDAEGRLILIDAMSYALEKYKPQVLIDMATLTGACVVALGEKIAGVFTPDDQLADGIIRSGKKTHERCWRMPLPEDYKELFKSDIADLNNVANTRYGGAITAALFLSEFVKDTRWAHIDIAGPAFAKKESAYCGAGGTGFGVRLLCDLLDQI
jgi:leucyl aminopeptidase